MRQIKFRAKCKEEVHTHHEGTEVDEWIYGYLVNRNHLRIKISEEHGGLGPGIVHVDVEIDPETVGQFTGLKDKAGTEIYEWDVVKLKYGEPVKIFFNESMASWDYEYAGGDCEPIIPDGSYYEPTGFEVVGNVFDNPELWEGEDAVS